MSRVRLEFLTGLREMLDFGMSNDVVFEQELGEKETVRDLVNQLATRYHRFRQAVFDVESQKLTGRVAIFVNGCNLELLNGLDTSLNDSDVLTFVPPIAGG